MYYANNENGRKVYIGDADNQEHYFCPACKKPMILKRGYVVSHHFAHKNRKHCDPWYEGKISLWHRSMQNKFPEGTQEIIVWNRDKTEYHIADILVNSKGQRYIFEFQHSNINSDEFITRTSFYLKQGCNVVWIFDYQSSKCLKHLYYTVEDSDGVRHVAWPGKDRIKLFDSCMVRNYLIKNMCNLEKNLQIYFYVSTGEGKIVHRNTGAYSRRMWEYYDPFNRKNYFIKPDFTLTDSLKEFEAEFYTEAQFDERIRLLCNRYFT